MSPVQVTPVRGVRSATSLLNTQNVIIHEKITTRITLRRIYKGRSALDFPGFPGLPVIRPWLKDQDSASDRRFWPSGQGIHVLRSVKKTSFLIRF